MHGAGAGEGAGRPNKNCATPPFAIPQASPVRCSLTLHRLKQQPPLAASIVVGPELARDAAVEAHITRSMLLIQDQEDEEAITRSLASAADEAAARKTTPKRRKHTKFEGAPNSAGLPSAGGSGSKPSHAMCLK